MDIKKSLSDVIVNNLNLENEITGLFELPKNIEFGDLALPCFSFAKALRKSPMEIAKNLSEVEYPAFVTKAVPVGGYLNFYLDKNEYYKSIILSALTDKTFGSSKSGLGKKCLVEHSSINPNASPHIGRSRNAIVGDFYVQLLKFEGYDVDVH